MDKHKHCCRRTMSMLKASLHCFTSFYTIYSCIYLHSYVPLLYYYHIEENNNYIVRERKRMRMRYNCFFSCTKTFFTSIEKERNKVEENLSYFIYTSIVRMICILAFFSLFNKMTIDILK